MSKQVAKNKLIDMVTGSNKTGTPIIIICKEGEEPDPKDYDPGTPIIRFVDFRKRNELREEANKSVKTGEI